MNGFSITSSCGLHLAMRAVTVNRAIFDEVVRTLVGTLIAAMFVLKPFAIEKESLTSGRKFFHRHLFKEGQMDSTTVKLAVVTGASTGIGLELARCCAEN